MKDIALPSEGIEEGNIFNCSPVLKKDQELHLFRKFNYIRYRIVKMTNGFPRKGPRLRPKPCKGRNLELMKESGISKLEKLVKKMNDTRNAILKANTRLVVKQAMKYAEYGSFDYDEWVSNGYCHVLKAIDKFDHRRGFKFSTYCVNVLKTNMWKDSQSMSKHLIPLEFSESLGSAASRHGLDFSESNLQYNKEIVEQILDFIRFSPIRRSEDKAAALAESFGLGGERKMLHEIGDKLGLSKERIRQMKKEAIMVASGSGIVYDPMV